MKDNKKTGWRRWNGGQECDMDDGPCACGAWHSPDEERVQEAPIYVRTFRGAKA